MRTRAFLLLTGLLAMGAVACAGDDDTAPATTEGTTVSPSVPADVASPPADPDAAVVTFDDASVPAITADGRVFKRADGPQGISAVPSEMAAALPLSPAVGPLVIAQLTPEGLARVLARADELGLLQPAPDYGDPGITDLGYLTVTVATASGSYEHRVYAPGEESGDPDADAARSRLQEFVDYVNSLQVQLADELGPWEPFVPDRWVVDTDPYVEFGDAQPWSLPVDPVDGCTTFEIEGDVDTVSGVYTITVPGEDSDQEHLVEVRPALPFTEC